jgi:hypothetical protein
VICCGLSSAGCARWLIRRLLTAPFNWAVICTCKPEIDTILARGRLGVTCSTSNAPLVAEITCSASVETVQGERFKSHKHGMYAGASLGDVRTCVMEEHFLKALLKVVMSLRAEVEIQPGKHYRRRLYSDTDTKASMEYWHPNVLYMHYLDQQSIEEFLLCEYFSINLVFQFRALQ